MAFTGNQDLRIRLEGRLEIVEQAVELHQRANRALASRTWATDTAWWPLTLEEGDETKRAVDELVRRSPDHELLQVLERARAESLRLARGHLAELNVDHAPGETLQGLLIRARALACPLMGGTLRVVDSPDAIQFLLALGATACSGFVLLMLWSATGEANPLFALIGLPLAFAPMGWFVFRTAVARKFQFTVSAEMLWVADLLRPISLKRLTSVRMVRSKRSWRVVLSFDNRPSQVCSLADPEAATLSGILKDQGVKVVSWDGRDPARPERPLL